MVREALAIHGGKPVRPTLLPYGRQSITEEDIQAVNEVLRSDWLTTGPKVGEFEEAMAAWLGSKHAISFSSGTAALHAAAYAAGLKPGDEAIVPPLTFCATANCVLYQGAEAVFADVAADTLNLSAEQVRMKITPRTRAVITVDYAGHPSDLDALMQMARERGIPLIEDACHALGAEHEGRKVGTVAHMTVFSFHPVKHLTTGEGGMVTTNDDATAKILRIFRNHGISSDARQRQGAGQWHYEMVLLGFNYRLTDIASALGLEQMKRLAPNLARRRQIAAKYQKALGEIPGVIVPTVASYANPAWHLYPIRLDLGRISADRKGIFRALRAENIGVNVHYIPVHLHPYYRERYGYKGGEYPVAENAYESLVSLPMFHGMSDADVDDVIRAVSKVMSHYALETVG